MQEAMVYNVSFNQDNPAADEPPAPVPALRRKRFLEQRALGSSEGSSEASEEGLRKRPLEEDPPPALEQISHSTVPENPPYAEKVRVLEVPGPVMREKLEEKDAIIQRLEQQLADENALRTTHATSLAQLQQRLKDETVPVDRRVKSLEFEKAKLREDLFAKSEAVNSLTNLNSTLQRRVSELTRLNKAQDDDFKRYKDSAIISQNKLNLSINELQTQKQDATTDAANEVRRRQTVEDSFAKIQREFTDFKRESDPKRLEKQLIDKDFKINMLQKTVSQLKEIVATEREQSKRRQEEQTHEIEDSKSLIQELQKSVLENSRVSSLETCIKELNWKIDALEEEKRSSESRASLEKSLIDAEGAKLKRLQDEQAAELERERAESTELRGQIENFKQNSVRITELEKQIEERDRNIDSLITEKRDYEMQALLEKPAIDSDRAKLNKLQKEETKLKQEIASRTSKIRTLEASVRNLEKVAEDTNCDLLREQAETTKLRGQIKDTVSELENKIEGLNRDIDTLETQKRDSETQALFEKPSIDSDRAKLKQLQKEETKLKQEVALGTSKIHLLETSVKKLKTAAEATNGELLRERAEITKLRDQIKETASEVARVTELETKIEELNRSIDSLETEKRDHEMQALLEKSAIDADRAKLKKVQTEETKLKQELASCISNIQTLETSVKNLERAAETSKGELLRERAEMTKLRDQVHDAAWEGARVTELETKIEELNRNIDSLETEKRDHETQALLEKPAIDSDRAKLKKLQEEEIKLTQLAASRTSQVQTLEDSVKNLHKVAEDERKASAYINSANVQHKTQITRLEDRIKVLKQTIECLEGEKRNLELHSSAQPLIASDREELKKLREANTIFEAGRSSIIELQKKLQECETIRASSDMRHRTLTETLNKLQKQITESVPKFRFDSLTESYGKLQDTLSMKLQQLTAFETAVQSQTLLSASEVTELKATVANLREQSGEDALLKSSNEARIRSLQQDLDKLTQECRMLRNSGAQTQRETCLEVEQLKTERTQLEARISLLKQEISDLTREFNALKANNGQGGQGIDTLQAQINQLKGERDHYKSELHAHSAGQAFGFTLSGRNRTLSHANVNAEIRHMKRQHPVYKLGQPLNQAPHQDGEPSSSGSSQRDGGSPAAREDGPATTESRSSRRKEPRGPWVSQRPSPYVRRRQLSNSDSDTDSSAFQSRQRKKGKARATNSNESELSDVSSETDDSSSGSEDEPVESDISHVAARYRRKGIRSHWSVEEQKRQLNKLGRLVVREALGVERNYRAFIRPGVTADRLGAFNKDREANGPKVRNTMIDKNGATTNDLKESSWNQELLLVLVKLAEQIVDGCKDARFPASIDWIGLFSERLYRVYLAVIKGKPRIKQGELESPEQIEARMLDTHIGRNKNNGETSFRHAKWQSRSEVCAIMIQACQQREDSEGVQFFRFLLRLVTKMQPGGMSEDEDGEDTVVTAAAGTIVEAVKFTKSLSFRHAYLNEVVEFLDKIPGFEQLLFIQSGRVKKRRIRGDARCKVSIRKPPRKWPKSFFAEGYLNGLTEMQRRKLVIGKKDIILLEVDFSQYAQTAGVSV
ncbi:hypothetical protein C8J55DRAFT_518936 [Lentinula edodes]|uniref:Uncharacterized protein n=1 Tax=Lentinula lateritia TaxID=40482 RepID=A0A9W9DK14_9AGAR|nr:hypothetical protein C8J55DRAFT_518936 [Lentinula edodes]